jgi:hypothetical protein
LAEAFAPVAAPDQMFVRSVDSIANATGDTLAVKVAASPTGLGPNRARSMATAAYFTAGTGWAVANGKATATAASGDLDMGATFLTVGETYQITWTLTGYSAGSARAALTGTTPVTGTTRTANGTYTDTLTAVTGNDNVKIETVTDLTGVVTLLEVREVLDLPDTATAEITLADTVTTATYLRVPDIIDPVKHCGALGDDDPDFIDEETIALQKAIDWAHGKGRPIHLGPRAYAVNGLDNPAGLSSTNMRAALWVQPGVHLIGIQGRTWLKNYKAGWYSVLQVRGGHDIVIDGVGIDGQWQTYASATLLDDSIRGEGLVIWNTGSDMPLERIRVENCTIQNTGHYGIGGQSTEMIGGTFRNNYFRNIGGDCFDLKNYAIYEKKLIIDGMFCENGCGHNTSADEDDQACLDIGGQMVLVNNVLIEGLDSYGGNLGNTGIRFRPDDAANGSRLGAHRASVTNARVVSSKDAAEGSGAEKRIIGVRVSDVDVYMSNVQVIGAYRAFWMALSADSDPKAILVGCRAVDSSGAGTATTDGTGFHFDSNSVNCTLVACEAEGCNVGIKMDGAGHSIDLLMKDCTTGMVATDAEMLLSTFPSLRFDNCGTDTTAASLDDTGRPGAVFQAKLGVMRDRQAYVDLISTADDASWSGSDAYIGGLRAFSQDASGPGAGLRAAIYAEMTNSAGSGGTRWRFDTTDASGAVTTALSVSGLAVTAGLQLVAPTYTAGTLPTGISAGRAFVSDSNATLAAGLGNTVAGGGANFVPVHFDGSNWKIG